MGFHRVKVMVQKKFSVLLIQQKNICSLFPSNLTFNFDLIYRLFLAF